jgi:hypothetical protein
MAKNTITENTIIAVLGGSFTAIAVATDALSDAGFVWGFVIGVFIVSSSVLLGKLLASKV